MIIESLNVEKVNLLNNNNNALSTTYFSLNKYEFLDGLMVGLGAFFITLNEQKVKIRI